MTATNEDDDPPSQASLIAEVMADMERRTRPDHWSSRPEDEWEPCYKINLCLAELALDEARKARAAAPRLVAFCRTLVDRMDALAETQVFDQRLLDGLAAANRSWRDDYDPRADLLSPLVSARRAAMAALDRRAFAAVDLAAEPENTVDPADDAAHAARISAVLAEIRSLLNSDRQWMRTADYGLAKLTAAAGHCVEDAVNRVRGAGIVSFPYFAFLLECQLIAARDDYCRYWDDEDHYGLSTIDQAIRAVLAIQYEPDRL